MKKILFIFLVLYGCGGGDAQVPSSIPKSEILTWEQGSRRMDNSYFDIPSQASRWDIYCTFFPPFTDNDIVASVTKLDNLAFDLSMLRPYGICPGPEGKEVSVVCVDNKGQKSDYSVPVRWTE